MGTDQAKAELSQGAILKSISSYRRYLRTEVNAFQKAQAYLELTRIYRIQARMNNAQLELKRAFEALQIPWPQNNLWSFVTSIFSFRKRILHSDFESLPRESQAEFLANLYVELGLSAYYLRQTWRMILSSVLSRRSCLEIGSSGARINWYGGTACLFALLKLRKFALKYIHQCQEVALKIAAPDLQGKAKIWGALMMDYLGHPVESAQIFQKAIEEYGTELTPSDLRLATITLAVNYLTRGHSRLALEALELMRKCNKCFDSPQDFGGMDSVIWYAIPSYAFLGHSEKISHQAEIAKSILSANNQEKWVLAQFLGCLIIAHHWSGAFDTKDVENFIQRFEMLGLRPRNTHFESCFYWYAKAYSLGHHLEDPFRKKQFTKSVRDLKKLPKHATSFSHRLVIEAIWLLNNRHYSKFLKACLRAENAALACENSWGLYEIWSAELKYYSNDHSKSARVLVLKQKIQDLVKEQGWVIDVNAKELPHRPQKLSS